MKQKHQGLVKWGILIVISATIVPAVIFGEPRVVDGQQGGDPWRNFFLDFQTLIAGVFAVVAAWWTVSAMQETDQSAERRHREQLALQTREVSARIQRMLARVPKSLEENAEKIQAFEETIPHGRFEPVWDVEVRVKLSIALFALRRIGALVADPALTSCRDLYPPTVEENLRQIEQWISASAGIIPQDSSALVHLFRAETFDRPDWYDEAMVSVFWEVRIAAKQLAADLQIWGEASLSDY